MLLRLLLVFVALLGFANTQFLSQEAQKIAFLKGLLKTYPDTLRSMCGAPKPSPEYCFCVKSKTFLPVNVLAPATIDYNAAIGLFNCQPGFCMCGENKMNVKKLTLPRALLKDFRDQTVVEELLRKAFAEN